ncbi:recombinase family protein [Rhodobacter capsulatus]|jgi:DNA invertase Pin-like site-specific DNA recombinase|uniref:Recombinase n=1 Tax=Rhodobacter capsulatus (strain ATCC BAA-309 / NBRC 16581 / SB1003) TaxID=272942 RepID=D5ASC8_RHOCB|nr:recombinase family protein [Rhodobacter capsulatus]ADE85019.1 recombinase [Rhodobacter capsulatus SB 1003]ETD02064.1 recombinase [Rhodobacter capsulatus DE442]ETD77738.1 recombinase [Rhodobacter capsulatus R121]ETE54096.1 recombinase [Rhodobacter capsulatus Y262]MDS0926674.1 recombinase family protein [Rhodobacter capsulatus]
MSRTVLYARVSTADQTLSHQRTQAEMAGFVIDEVVADHGVSGVSTRLRERAEGRRLFDLLRKGDVLVVRWLDRLGRNYTDVTEVVRHFMQQGVIVRTVINNMTFDGSTSDPVQQAVRDSMIAFMAATAQAQAEALREAQRAGIEAAKANGNRYRGKKPTFDRSKLIVVRDMLDNGAGASEISKATGISRQAILRIRENPAQAEAALARWGM